MDTYRVIAEGYDRMGERFPAWNAERPPEGRNWFLGEVLARLPQGSAVLELGCGPGTDAFELAEGRRYVGVDLSPVQLSIARRRSPGGSFVVGDLTSIAFMTGVFDGVVAFYTFNHVPEREVGAAFAAIHEWLRPGGYVMLGGLPTMDADDRVEEWLDVPMFFGGVVPDIYDQNLRGTGFEIEMSEFRFPTDEWWGTSGPLWIIARRPEHEVRAG